MVGLPGSRTLRAMRGTNALRAALAGLALLLAVAAPARAQQGDPARAEELIKQANDFRRQGHDERAVPLLREAYQIARTPRTAGQLGLAELALGYWTA